MLLLLMAGFAYPSFSQEPITGKVSVGDTALSGVTVTVKGTKSGTQTDHQGNFSISAPANSTLVFSLIGYAPQEVKVGSQHRINVQMVASAQNLNEVVVVGYGTQKKTSLTA
ncbi:MAG TPA: carboxypeptidase-like regulatory domain-containing protein, partial [Puia sp.]